MPFSERFFQLLLFNTSLFLLRFILSPNRSKINVHLVLLKECQIFKFRLISEKWTKVWYSCCVCICLCNFTYLIKRLFPRSAKKDYSQVGKIGKKSRIRIITKNSIFPILRSPREHLINTNYNFNAVDLQLQTYVFWTSFP